jgi:hypothetical protein
MFEYLCKYGHVEKPVKHSKTSFKIKWRNQPARFFTSWDKIERLANQVIESGGYH